MLLATGTLVFSLVTMSSAISYADGVYRQELRIQGRFNARACLEAASLMAAKNYFISGDVVLNKFGCIANFANDFTGSITINIEANLGDVLLRSQRVLQINADSINIISESIL